MLAGASRATVARLVKLKASPGRYRLALTDWQVWLSTLYYYSIVTPLYSVGLFVD